MLKSSPRLTAWSRACQLRPHAVARADEGTTSPSEIHSWRACSPRFASTCKDLRSAPTPLERSRSVALRSARPANISLTKMSAKGCEYARAPPGAISGAGNGDSILIAAADPVARVQTARHRMDEGYAAPGQPRLRIALHHGEVHTRQRESDLQLEVVGGSAILCAARVEPVVEPGQIWATEEFRQQFLQRPSLWRTSPLRPAAGGALFNVRKPGTSEPDLWVRLHRLES